MCFAPDAQADTHFLTSKSPTSNDQISSLLSTFQTLIKPLMSAVATKEESWLNIAQVTESLWPVDNIRWRKKITLLSHKGLDNNFIYSYEV